LTTAVTRRRISRLKTAALKYAAALDEGTDLKKTAALYKRLLKLIDPEDLAMLAEAWLGAHPSQGKRSWNCVGRHRKRLVG
jgi:hypothetical protein